MRIEEIISRLESISEHAVHYVGEPPLILSLDDGIALNEAAKLLKRQEPVKPKIYGLNYYLCGNCEKRFRSVGTNYCPRCGREVKWE